MFATPIGNLQDISFRAVETLQTVDIIACEDTRHTGKLLKHLGIKQKLVSYHEHNEVERAAELAATLEKGTSVAVVSDAGTPGISDPSFRIVQRAIEIGAQVVPVPGPVAFVSALVASGLPTDAVFFGGFLPSKKSERRRRLREIADVPATLAFYESPRRLSGALADCLEILGDRECVIAREITKLHEEFSRGKISRLLSEYSSATLKGEAVLLIDRVRGVIPERDAGTSLTGRLAELEAEGIDRKTALKRAAKEFGVSRSEAYRIAHAGD
ncbi:MAG TPA: 16S rRNA (cytidine(1402)-2'-O)-methyltransferase [Candidatus Limnocylindria bacterium]|nr:16S rRNA (cytidine(1402)-2'-O)-methyltransferase [Candidatus Limnocylindria bacterium]